MSSYVLKNVKFWYDGYDFSTKVRSISMPCTIPAVDSTQMGVDDEACIPGTPSYKLNVTGFHDNATVLSPDKYVMTDMGTTSKIITVTPNGATLGQAAYSFYTGTSSYTPLDGTVGDMAAYSWSVSGTGKLIRGTLMESAAKTASGSGTARELRGMDEGDVAYIVVHCTALDATSLDVTVVSDTTTGMATPEARSFGLSQFTAVGAQIGTFTAPAGISADDCWQIIYVITGGNTDATITVSLFIP
jgi:hypothetical protein